MSTSLQETGEKQVRITWSTIKLPNGATQDDDNHARRDPMNLSPYACSGLSTRKNNRTEKSLSLSNFYLSVYLSVCLPTYLPACLSVRHLSTCLPACLPAFLPACQPACLSIRLMSYFPCLHSSDVPINNRPPHGPIVCHHVTKFSIV